VFRKEQKMLFTSAILCSLFLVLFKMAIFRLSSDPNISRRDELILIPDSEIEFAKFPFTTASEVECLVSKTMNGRNI
jgi:hypothetical protein